MAKRLVTIVVLALLAASCSGSDNDGPSTATVTTVDEWMAAVEAQDTMSIVALYADDATWRDEADLDAAGDTVEFVGREGVGRGWNIWAFVDEVLDVEAVAVTDEAAVVRWTFDGYWGQLTGLSVLELDDGVITAETVYYDSRQGP